MTNKLQKIKQTWSYNHKTAIIALALAVAHVWPIIASHLPPLPTYAATIEWEAPPPVTMADLVEQRAMNIYTERVPFCKEQARQEAIQEYAAHLLELSATSTHVDYDALRAKYK